MTFTAIRFAAPVIQAALIDLDGTLIDTADDFTAGLNHMLIQLGAAAISREEVITHIGKGSEHLVQSVLARRLSASDAQLRFSEALELYQTEYARINGHQARLYPDVSAGLSAMQSTGLKLACVTNKPRRFAVALLEQHKLASYFTLVIGGDSLPRKKPDPLPMQTACETLGVMPHEAVTIGDSENDALAGHAAGTATLTVPYGYNHGQSIQTINSDGIVGSMLVAAQVIAAHNARRLPR